MNAVHLLESASEARFNLRNEPVQARSTARLTALLDAAAVVIDKIGFERLTTAMVADGAGASIGTVYRYFPDRIALLQALGARNLDRILGRLGREVMSPKHPDLRSALAASTAVVIDAYRTEPGFRGVRVGDSIDLRPAQSDHTFNSIVADRLLDGLVSRFGIADTPELRLRCEAGYVAFDALVHRAFLRDPRGHDEFLNLGRDAIYRAIEGHVKA